MWNKQPILPIILTYKNVYRNLRINREDSKFMLTTHKHWYDMKPQTDNAEHINRLSVLCFFFLAGGGGGGGARIQTVNRKDNDACEAILIFRHVGEPGETWQYIS